MSVTLKKYYSKLEKEANFMGNLSTSRHFHIYVNKVQNLIEQLKKEIQN